MKPTHPLYSLLSGNQTDKTDVLCPEDEDISDEKKRDALLAHKTRILRRKLSQLLPWLDTTVEFAWTGTFGESVSGLPIIDVVPGLAHCWIALGYGGNGTTYASIAAGIIAGGITGRLDSDGDLYRFSGHEAAT